MRLVRVLFYLITILTLTVGASKSTPNLQGDALILLPFTKPEHLRTCEDYFDQAKLFEQTLSCANKSVFKSKPLKSIKIPECYVISVNSPDVIVSPDGVFNFIGTSILLLNRIVGFYENQAKTLYLVETYDLPLIYRHELQHYFLDLAEGDGNGRHDHAIWDKCEPPYYQPSQEAVDHAKENLKKSLEIVN